MEWFEEWFNTAEYLEVYKHRNEKEAGQLVRLILDNISYNPGASILDLACGAGRHSLLFAQKGFKVTAVDLSETLLKIAIEHAKDLNLDINFLRSDIRTLNLNRQFDIVMNLFTSFGYFAEDLDNFAVIKKAATLLKPKGTFVLDYINKCFIEENLIKESEEEISGGKLIQKRWIEKERVLKDITIKKNGSTKRYFESVRLFSYDELLDMFENNGLVIKKKYGDFKGNKYDMLNSPRVILFAEK